MMLLTKANRNALPALYTTDGDKNAEAVVKFFTPDGNFTWFASEFDGDDTFFGLVDSGHTKELGYFSLKELTAARGLMGLPVERDRWFSATPLGELGSKVHDPAYFVSPPLEVAPILDPMDDSGYVGHKSHY